MTPHSPPADGARERAAAAWLTALQQELLAPAHALRERAAMLAEDVQPVGPHGLFADLLTTQAVAEHLEDLISDIGPKLMDPERFVRDAAALSRLRHDLRTPLHQIIGYCDLWLEDADEAAAVDRFRTELISLRATGRELNTRIEKLRALDPDRAEPADAEGDAAVIERLVREWAAVTPAARRPDVAPGRLLVVDDNEFNRDVLARRLERQGHVVTPAIHGKHALELLAQGEFDVVLLDLLMPELNGLEVLQRLKADEKLRHLPVIMISALNDIDGVAHCITLGADDYLPRPYNQVILKARIDALLERKRLRDRDIEHVEQIRKEKERADGLLLAIMPPEVVGELQATGRVAPRRYEHVAVLFADIVGFTPYCDAHPPEDVVRQLRRLIERFEQSAVACGVQKIKTIGDAFMAAAGLFHPTENAVLDCVRCGVNLVKAAAEVPPHWQVRVGIHNGSVMGGVVGTRQYLFDIWGDTVNTASRIQHSGQPGKITLSADAWAAIASCCRGDSRGTVDMKGKVAMELVQFEAFGS